MTSTGSLDALLAIVHEDDDLLVVNKPAGLVCHPTKHGEHSSLIGRVRLHLGHSEGRLVNRLDRETSGIVVLAKSTVVARELGQLFSTAAVRKTYLGIVHGRMLEEQLTIDAPIGNDTSSRVAIKGCVRDDGALAQTSVRRLDVIERDGEPFTLIEATPRTGRKHQIRIHLAHVGHPIVGDKLYGADEGRYLRLVEDALTSDDWRALHLEHHALHAAAVSCIWREREWCWRVPPPSAFCEFIGLSAITPDSGSQ